ncbi:alpha/beta fold hydrolase [Parapedobacter sp. DT-150]|uniref:alpha/beta fold hydrolase n=1 Tax=Parapedobacter sp. DT-150 TaxID=3396162 RepID=UPI003F199CBF
MWTAEDSVDGVYCRYVLQLDTLKGGGLTVAADAIYLMMMDRLRFDTASVNRDSLFLWGHDSTIKDSFRGKREGDSIVGEFTRNGQQQRLTFRRFDLKAHRPQTPTRPFPYVEEEVRFANRDSSVVFDGTFTYPERVGQYPAVLIISGSGPQDRDGNLFFHDPYLVIADYLTRQGIAVLRLDDHRVGKTVVAPGANVDYVADAVRAIEFLKSHENVADHKVGIIGHSQGGLVAMDVAAAVPDLATVVTFGSPISLTGIDFFTLAISNNAEFAWPDLSPVTREKAIGLFNEVFRILKEAPSKRKAADLMLKTAMRWSMDNRDNKEALAAFRLTRDDAGNEKAIGKMLTERFTKFLSDDRYYILSYDPGAVFPKIKCPVLAVYGEHDNRISFPAEQERLDVLASRTGLELEAQHFARINHFFQTTASKRADDAEVFGLDETVSPEVLELLRRWLTEQFNAD